MPNTRKRNSPTNLYIGVDPGLNGGITFMYKDKVTTKVMPKTQGMIWNELNLQFKTGKIRPIAMVEEIPYSIPGISKSSMSKLYGSYASLCAYLLAAGIETHLVTAKVWQKRLGIKKHPVETTNAWKTRLAAKAKFLYPDLPVWDQNKGTQLAVADSILIAEYCRLLAIPT
jgi:hypothetical protein